MEKIRLEREEHQEVQVQQKDKNLMEMFLELQKLMILQQEQRDEMQRQQDEKQRQQDEKQRQQDEKQQKFQEQMLQLFQQTHVNRGQSVEELKSPHLGGFLTEDFNEDSADSEGTNEENLEEENTDVVEFIIYDADFFNITDEVKQSCDSEDDSTNEARTADGAEGVFGEEKPFIKCDEVLAVELTWVTGAVLDIEKAKEEEHETIVLDTAKDGPQTRAVHHTSSIFLRNLTTSITNTEIEVVCQKFDGYSCVAIDKEADGGDDNQHAEEKSNLDKDRDGPLKLEGEHENDDTGIVLEAVEKKISEEETAAIDDEGIDGAAEDSDDREERQQEEKLKLEKPGEEKTAKLWSCVPGYFCHKFRKRKQTKDSFVDKIISYN